MSLYIKGLELCPADSKSSINIGYYYYHSIKVLSMVLIVVHLALLSLPTIYTPRSSLFAPAEDNGSAEPGCSDKGPQQHQPHLRACQTGCRVSAPSPDLSAWEFAFNETPRGLQMQ